MESLRERDWNKINEILLEAYTLDSECDVTKELMRLIYSLIIYDKGFFIMCDENDRIVEKKSAFINISEDAIKNYINKFYELDYVKKVTNSSNTTVFRDTDEVENSVRSKTKIYREFFLPNDMEYGCGIVFINDSRVLGILNMFRTINFCDFTDKELRMLDVLKNHITNIILSTRKNDFSLDRKKFDISNLADYDLSKRENEIIELMLEGMSNLEIGDKLAISISTVKKHIYNIFTKLGINSRMQLLKIVQK